MVSTRIERKVLYCNQHILDTVDVGHMALRINDINIRVGIGHKQQLVLPIIINL